MTFRIITWGGIGDALLLTPSLRAIKRTYPGSALNVYCICRSHFEILKHNPHIDRLKLISRGKSSWLRIESIKFMHFFFQLLKGSTGQSQQPFYLPAYGRFHPSLLINRHATEIIAEMLDVSLIDRKLQVALTNSEENGGKAIVEQYNNPVAIHVTGRCCESKNWPTQKWEELVKRNSQYTFLQLGLPEEVQIRGAIDLRGKTTIREAIALLKYVKGFVGVDSSIAHAANAVDTTGVVLFGPSTPEVWAHSNVKVITKRLRCAPCVDFLVGTKCPYGAPCLADISVEEVELALREQIAAKTLKSL